MRLGLAALAAVLAGAAALVAAGPAGATNECRGLMVCVPVAGPWVVVPVGSGVPRAHVEFQLSCPRRYVAGGLDAELSTPAIDVAFPGSLGSPVSPGITTSRDTVFVGTYVGEGAPAPTFRPRVGCLPAAAGGERVPTAAARVFPPGRPTIRRVRTLTPVPGTQRRLIQGCAAGERLVSASHAVGFYTASPPDARLARSIVVAQRVRHGRVILTVRTGEAVAVVSAIVQLSAVCAGGQ